MNQDTTQTIEQLLSKAYTDYSNLLETILIIVVLVAIHFVINVIVRRQTEDDSVRYKWRKNLAYFLSFIGFLMIGRIWFEGMASVATFFGLLSAGLAIALRDPVTGMAGWIFLV